MLNLKNISANAIEETVLTNINLKINPSEIHVIIGPKHSGKSSLCHVITGHPGLDVIDGEIVWKRKQINQLTAEERMKKGIFISFQLPPDFENLSSWELSKEIFDTSKSTISNLTLKYNECCELLGLGDGHGIKQLNGTDMNISQSKRNELIHMLLTKPELIILDNIDEGLADKEIELVGSLLSKFLQEKKRSAIIVTHNRKLLDMLNPTHVHVMVAGKLTLLEDKDLYKRIIDDGYSQFS